MKPQKQLITHWPEVGMYGDCHRTAIAVMLDMDAKDVPHFMDGTSGIGPAPDAHMAAETWLNARGYTQVSVPFNGEVPLDMVLATVKANCFGAPFILGGTSRNRVNHSVVAMGDEIICDPSQTNSGIIGPCDDGFYWATFFGTILNKEII